MHFMSIVDYTIIFNLMERFSFISTFLNMLVWKISNP